MSRSSPRPVIVINGVTYRSPDEIPENLRAIWDENIQTLEQRGVDWRRQQRIDLTWSREGNVVSQRFRIERHSPFRPQTLLSAIFAVYLTCWMALTFYGMLWREPPLVFDFSSGLLYVLAGLFYGPWVAMFVNAFHKRHRLARQRSAGQEDFFAAFESRHNILLNPETPAWKVVGMALGGMAVTGMMTYLAVFGGTTRLLHYAERHPGETTAVVTQMHGYSSKHCDPWIELEGFRHAGKQLCVDRHFYEHVNVGDRVRITGMMSRYAMEPERFEVVVTD